MSATSFLVRLGRSMITRAVAGPVRRRPDRRYRAAILKLDRLGDFVLSVSAIRTALAHYGERDCLLMLSPAAAELATVEFPDTPLLVLPPSVGHQRLWAEARRARAALGRIAVDEVLCLRHQRWDWDELVLRWLGARRAQVLDHRAAVDPFAERNTYRCPGVQRYPFSGVANSPMPAELLRHQQLLAAAFGGDIAPERVLPSFRRVQADPSWESPVVIAPFGSDAIRDFPPAALDAALQAAGGVAAARIVLTGEPRHRPRLEQLAATWRAAAHDVNCAPVLTTVEFARLVAGARLVVTVETATAHLAAAFDRPAVVAIGGGHFGEFAPWSRSRRQQWLTHRLDCFGCNWRCVHPEPWCLTRLAPEQVGAAVRRVLSEALA